MRKERRGGLSDEEEGATGRKEQREEGMRKMEQRRGRGDEKEGATRRKEQRGGRGNEGATRGKDLPRSQVYPSVNENG